MYILFRGTFTQRLRLASGLILFTFALTHFVNHSLGLFSIDTMNAMQEWRTAVTRSLPGGIILGLALVTHIGLALGKLARRKTLKMPVWEAVQILLGLAIPFLLFPHIVNTRVAHELFGVNDVYFYELVRLWPAKGWTQSLLLLLVWVHGCVGLHFWLRLANWYQRIFPVVFALAVLIPVTALAGFMVGGRSAAQAIADKDVFEAIKSFTRWPDPAADAALKLYGQQARYGFYVLLGLVLLILSGRWIAAARQPKVAIHYTPEPSVYGTSGATLLEISRMNNVPHLSVCGGRARCSTCRVQVLHGGEALPQPAGAEAETLHSISAAPGVRLACQVRPTGPLTVHLLLRPEGAVEHITSKEALGTERTLAILFLDVRGFTSMSDDRLPYDVVFILNRLFAAAGAAIRAEGGWIDKYLGDGLLAVFGRDHTPEEGCCQAIRAARAIDRALDAVNAELESELGEPLRIGMGLHVGPLVLGEIGHEDTAALTVIGRTVNAAARLEAACKELKCQFVISAEAARLAGIPIGGLRIEKVSVRGLAEPVEVIPVDSARDLPMPVHKAKSGNGGRASA